MNDKIALKIINLAHRTDRRAECLIDARESGLTLTPAHFFNAKYIADDGARACALSHAMALSEFLFTDDRSFVLILEDDFQIRNKGGFADSINALISAASMWDVYLLGHNEAVPVEGTPASSTFRIINAQTTSGYLVGRAYVPKLIENFFRSADLLSRYKDLPSPNREATRHFTSCDMLWKELQISDRFWASVPALIQQRESFSDVQKKVVSYGV